MAARLQLSLAAVLGLVALALGGVLLFGGSSDESRANPAGGGLRGFLPPQGFPAGDFRLRDQDGKVASLREYRGRPVVLTFMYSTCEDSCPVMAQQIRTAMDELGHDVPALVVSVDPKNDDAGNAKGFLVKQKVLGRMRFLIGSRAQLAPIWKRYGIQPQLGDGSSNPKFDHSAKTLLFGPDGRLRSSFPFDQMVPADLAHDIGVLERRQS